MSYELELIPLLVIVILKSPPTTWEEYILVEVQENNKEKIKSLKEKIFIKKNYNFYKLNLNKINSFITINNKKIKLIINFTNLKTKNINKFKLHYII